ncbi:MAG: hypothetical protein QOG88_937 [Actinomycetota bacterium]|nr:hypothetical protein [Actinomycetota bacterium]
MGATPQGPLPELSDEARPARTGRRRLPRRAATALLTIALLWGGALLLITIATSGVRSHLEAARQALQKGRSAVSYGNLDLATASFQAAEKEFGAAESGTHGGIAGVVHAIPGIGNNVEAIRSLATAGGQLAHAGETLVNGVAKLPSGLGSLAPQGGRIPISTLAGLSADVAGAQQQAEGALATIAGSPHSWLLGTVSNARAGAVDELTSAVAVLGSAHDLLSGLPTFAGGHGTTRYFFGAANPAELRGTGGIIGAYSIATMRSGAVSFSPFKPIESLTDVPADALPAPSPDYRQNYDRYGGAGDWHNLNLTPDLPSAARAILSAYEHDTGVKLDGVITADPFALQALLEISGPVDVPGLHVTVDATNVVDFVANQAYDRFRGPVQRKEVLGDVAREAFSRFLASNEHGVQRLRTLAHAAADGHIEIYSTDPVFQRGLVGAGVSGGIDPSVGADYESVTINSASGTKVDFYATRTIGYDVQLGGSGESVSQTTVRLTNDAPTSGPPPYVIGPVPGGGAAGDQISMVRESCPANCQLDRVTRNGDAIEVGTGTELGTTWFEDRLTVASNATSTLSFGTHRFGVWSGDDTGGSYALQLNTQTTIQPTKVTVTIHAPAGTRISSTSEPMEVDGGTAVWTGTPGPRLDLSVSFQAPLPLRWWRDLT